MSDCSASSSSVSTDEDLQEIEEVMKNRLRHSALFAAIRNTPRLGIDRKADVHVSDWSRVRLNTNEFELAQLAFIRDSKVYEQWLTTERDLELKWEELEERTYAELVGFGKRKSSFERYEPPEDSPKVQTCKHGALGVVTPWTCNRVLLSLDNAPELTSQGVPDPDPTYVNASPMSLKFIAAAVPQNDDAREAFWRCIYEQDVAQVVMLNQPLDMDNVPYWPHTLISRPGSSQRNYTDAIDQPVVFGRMRVTCLSASRESSGWTRTFRVELLRPDAPVKEVTQHHFTQWPDMAIPIDPKLFLDGFMLPVLTHRAQHGRPVLVHCHAGLGRTGTFITIAILLLEREALKKAEIPKIPTVAEKIFELRKQRPDQVQALEQFKFIHRIVYGFEIPQKHDSWERIRQTLAIKRTVSPRDAHSPSHAQRHLIKQSMDLAHSCPEAPATSPRNTAAAASSLPPPDAVDLTQYLNRQLTDDDLSALSQVQLVDLCKLLSRQKTATEQ